MKVFSMYSIFYIAVKNNGGYMDQSIGRKIGKRLGNRRQILGVLQGFKSIR